MISIGFLNMIDHTRNIFIFDLMIYSITIEVRNLFSTCLYYNERFLKLKFNAGSKFVISFPVSLFLEYSGTKLTLQYRAEVTKHPAVAVGFCTKVITEWE